MLRKGMIRFSKTDSRRVTIKDIAELARVSIGTVDRVLHNRGEVNAETHQRVMSFVEDLGYTPNLLAKSLALKKNFSISALIPEAGEGNPYWKKPLEGILQASDELKDFNTSVHVYNYDPGEEASFIQQFENMLSGDPDGIIAAPHFHAASLKFSVLCAGKGIPLVLIDTDFDNGPRLAYFGQDAQQSGLVAGKLMHYGLPPCSNVLILNLAPNKAITRHMKRREEGFMVYFEKALPEACIHTSVLAIDLSLPGEPEKSLEEVFALHGDIRGIFVTNSRAHLIAPFLARSNRKHLLVIGYDLIDANREYIENGTIDFLICQKPEEQGYKTVMALFNYLLTGRLTEAINHSPIDILVKENAGYYNSNNN